MCLHACRYSLELPSSSAIVAAAAVGAGGVAHAAEWWGSLERW
jgi:hypothetical protein